MTKEEMAKAYAEGFEDKKYGEIAYTAFLCGFTAKCESSLPSDIDEAARKYGFEEYRRRCEGGEYGTSEEAFKAGAEWMAGQGVSVDGKVIMDFSEPYDIINRRLIAKLGDALLEVEPGEVIVQIRKKQ